MQLKHKNSPTLSFKFRIFLRVIFAFFFVVTLWGCSSEYKFQKAQSGKQKAWVEIEKALKKEPQNLLWQQRKLDFIHDRPTTSLPALWDRYVAYSQWLLAFQKADKKLKTEWLSKGLREDIAQKKKDATLKELLYWGYKTANPDSLQWVISKLPDLPGAKWWISQRDSLAFEAAKRLGTPEAFENFAKKYPESKQNQEAKSTGSRKYFLEQTASGNNEAYREFIAQNPKHPYAEEAKAILTDRLLGFGLEQNATVLLREPWIEVKEKRLAQSIQSDLKTLSAIQEMKLIPWKDSLGWLNTEGEILKLVRLPADSTVYSLINKPFKLVKGTPWFNEPFGNLSTKIKYGGFGYYVEKGKIINYMGEVIEIDSNLKAPVFIGPRAFIAEKLGKKGIFRTDGKILLSPEWDDLITVDQAPVAWERYLIGKRLGKFELLDIQKINEAIMEGKKPVIESPKFDELPEYTEPLALEVKVNGLLGYLNPEKGWLLKPEWENIFKLSKNLAIALKNGSYYFTDSKGKRIKDSGFKIWKENGPYIIWQNEGLWGLLNKSGEEIVPPIYDSVFALNKETILLRFNGNWQLQTGTGNRLLLPPIKSVRQLSLYDPQNANAELMPWYEITEASGKRTILNKKGIRAFDLQAQDYRLLSEKVWALQVAGKWGIFKSQKGWLLRPKPTNIGNLFNEKYLTVIENGTFNLMDISTGKKVFKTNFGTELQPLTASNVTIFKVQSGGGFNLADSKGQLLFPGEVFDRINAINDTTVELERNGFRLRYSLESFKPLGPRIKSLPNNAAIAYTVDSTAWNTGDLRSFGLWDANKHQPISQEIWSDYVEAPDSKFPFLWLFNDGGKMGFYNKNKGVFKQTKSTLGPSRDMIKRFLSELENELQQQEQETP